MIDEEKLADLYTEALRHEKAKDFDKAAHYYRQMLAADAQDHAGAAVRLAAIGYGDTPKVAPAAYVTTLFDQHADVFDLILVDQLGYDVPEQVRLALEKAAKGRVFSSLLDLGCGTGLMGEALGDMALHKTGVDLAENMISIAHEKGDYDKLWVGDLMKFLHDCNQSCWNLITATDVLPYMGDVDDFFRLVDTHLDTEGIFAFSTELLPPEQDNIAPYKIGAFQRFAHRQSYIEACLSAAGLGILAMHDIVVRQEQGVDVNGQLFLAMKREDE